MTIQHEVVFQNRIAALIDESTDLFGYTDKSGIPLYVNKTGQALYGIVPGKKHFIEYLSEKDKKFFQDIVIPRLSIHKSWEGEVVAINPISEIEFPVWLRLFPVSITEDQTYFVCSGSDLRNFKTIHNTQLAQSKMIALGEMVAEMAHEINNPLMIIQIKAQMLRDKLTGNINAIPHEKLLSDLQLIEKNSLRIQKIVNSSRTITRNAEIDPYTQVSILTIFDETIELCQEKFLKKNIKFILKIDPEITYSDMIEARGSEILQVIINLLSNSYDAICNQNNGWIELHLTNAENQFEIQVLDSGDLIPKEIANKMMTPFFTTKPQGYGTGLGLSLSKQIVENHKGQLYFDHASKNTRFVILLKKKIS